jgi:hypothetical protein
MVVAEIDNTRASSESMSSSASGRAHANRSRTRPGPSADRPMAESAFTKLGIFRKQVSEFDRIHGKGPERDPFQRSTPWSTFITSVSLGFLVPMGGDGVTLIGNIALRFTEGWEPFTPMAAGRRSLLPKGELVCQGRPSIDPKLGMASVRKDRRRNDKEHLHPHRCPWRRRKRTQVKSLTTFRD